MKRAMTIAVTMHDGRVSPVYGVAKEILLVAVQSGRETHRERRALDGDRPTRQVQRLADLGVDTLICGGITTSQAELLNAAGISVVSHVAGPVDHVIRAYLRGTLTRKDGNPQERTHGRA
jgi:predicted Fe-Mo cluster-binding NifX family protein